MSRTVDGEAATERSDVSAVRAFYGGIVDVQWSRFDRFARIEEYVLRRCMRDLLPPPEATVVDIGGGNGRHALYLAEQGYQVLLGDVTPELVDDARRRATASGLRLAAAEVCDARSLPWPDASADGGLLLGPMYCLADAAQRMAVLREARRVLKPGAPLFVQFFSRVAALRSILEVAPATVGLFNWADFLAEGHFTDDQVPDYLRVHYFATADQARAELTAAGLKVHTLRGMDGPAPSYGQRNLADAPEPIVRQWAEIAYVVGASPEYRCTSTHLLAVAHRPPQGEDAR
jgi:ubiquinone/menaquinone biosynthesis C-methylase UbiE